MENFALNAAEISKIKQLFQHADALIFSAGAGMGVDSGLPDFRGNAGMWKTYPELGKQHINFTNIANPNAFERDPRLAWGFYGHRLDLYRKTKPHQGFTLLKNLAEQRNLPYFVFTSNVDGQFQKAGFDEQAIYECHGSIHYVQCLNACTNDIESADMLAPQIDAHQCQWLGELPNCLECGSLIRPNILMFDDYHWISDRQEQQRNRLEQWLKTHRQVLVIEMGAGTAIPTVRLFSERFSPNLIRINPREYQLPRSGGCSLAMGAQHGVQTILHALTV